MAWVGVLTAVLAATIALAQNDIKKILAYSTVSQLGYMFLGCGVGGYTAGVFHVMTHAFFKALLFLGAGSVIHGMHEQQDITQMGGLRSRMPKTFIVFGIAWLAICGIPPFSGFFSKDEILWLSYSSPHGSTGLWFLGAVTAVLTAFYMTRLFALTFLGQPRFHEDSHHPVHESPTVMILPLQILAALSALGGFLGFPHHSWLGHWLEPIIPEHARAAENAAGVAPSMEWVLMAVSVIGAGFGILFALKTYRDLKAAERLSIKWAGLRKILSHKWYVDEIYEFALVQPIYRISKGLWRWFDVAVIDRVVLGFGKGALLAGQTARVIQTGSIQIYALMFLGGLIIMVGYLVYGMAS